jgi:hypothetical protein
MVLPMLLALVANGPAQDAVKLGLISAEEEAVLRRLPDWRFTTKAYQEEALRMLLEEANSAARELGLKENLPILKNDLIEVHIGSPARIALGTISTTNYAYVAGVGRAFSSLVLRDRIGTFERARAKYTWPISRMDTNHAFQVATQLLASVRIDVAALNRECSIGVGASILEETDGRSFVPIYWVAWGKSGRTPASIEFLEPERSVRQIHIYEPRYILRKPAIIPNLAELLGQTNAPIHTNTGNKP